MRPDLRFRIPKLDFANIGRKALIDYKQRNGLTRQIKL